MKSYFPFIISGFITLLAVYLSHKSRMKLLRELKSEFETTTHQPAESIKTHKPTEEYIKFLDKPSNRKTPKKFSIVRPSPSAFKTFLFGLLFLFLSSIVLVVFWNESDSGISDDIILFVILILYIYAFYLGVSSIVRGLYNAFTRNQILLSLIVLFIILIFVSA